MKKTGRVLIPFLAAALLSACVSSQEYKARLSDIDSLKQNIEELEGKLAAAEKENDSLRAELGKLLSDHQALTAERDRLAKELADKDARLRDTGVKLSELVTEVAVLKDRQQKLLKAKKQEVSELKQTYDRLMEGMHEQIEKGQVELTRLKDKLSLRMVNKILFASGSATVKEEGKRVLDDVAEALKNLKDSWVMIAGHTDNVPISARLAKKFPTNWELSTMRATNVVRYLESTGKVDPALLGVAGFSKYRPVADNETPEGRAKNRRIEITLIPIELGEKPAPSE